MIYNYLKQAVKHILNNKLDSLINIFGLTIGISAFVILINYVGFEYSFDSSILHNKSIYRIVSDVPQQNGSIMNTAMSSGYFSKAAEEHFTEIISSTRITPSFETLVKFNNSSSYEKNFWFADSSFFNVFKFNLVQGNPAKALDGSFKIVISERIAKKYFGDTNPINQTLLIHNKWQYTVSGILKDLPSNLHLKIDFLASPDSIGGFHRNFWGALGLFNYVLLKEGTNPKLLEKDFYDFSVERMGENWANIIQFKLQSVSDIHLKSDRMHEVANTSDAKQLNYLIGIAFLILFMAGVNFMNLYSSRAEYRSKEVGLKKVIGAHRLNLIFQFLIESVFYTFISVIISLILILYTWNIFENFINTDIPFEFNKIFYLLLAVLLFIGVLAGIYPALYLSSFEPIYAIKALFRIKKNGSFLRKSLVIAQFSLSLFMIIATLIVYLQMNYIRSKNLGFDHTNLLTIKPQSVKLISNNATLKDEIRSIQGVKDICFSSTRIDNILSGQRPYVLEDSAASGNSMDYMIRTIWVDDNFIPLYKLNIVEGRNFSLEYSTDADYSIIMNQAAVKLMGIKNPIGKKLVSYLQDSNYVLNIIGVMNDFNYQSLHTPIEPLFFRFGTENLPIMSIKSTNQDLAKVIRSTERKMEDLIPEFPSSVNILSDTIDAHYDKENKISTLYQILTFLSIFIACLGLFGIVSFVLEKKTKSTGIRKILGATDVSLFINLSKELIVWLCISVLISFPVSIIVMNNWLQGFAYKTKVYWWIFPIAFIILFMISLITIAYKTYKTVRVNPSDCLRYE